MPIKDGDGELLGSPSQLFPHVFHKLFRKTNQIIRISQTFSNITVYVVFFKDVKFEDL